ncbi:MAG: thermonuclease family protein, partial [Actinomycetota bacterium]|nr:thermonuclease family protein [Actinomycetota bacterium]
APGVRPPGGLRPPVPRRALRATVTTMVLVAFAFIATGCGSGAPALPAAAAASGNLPAGVDLAVQRVIDGDTIVVAGGERVRLIGVDTPETKAPNQPIGCFGEEASRFTTSLLPPGTPVRLVGDAEQRDKYGRLLAYVYRRSDGLFVNAELLRRGFGQVLTIPPNVAHTDEFVAMAGRAREASQGLWAACILLPNGRPGPASSSTKVGSG